MRALLTSPLGFLIGLSLGALGGGGSILAVPVLVYAAGQAPRNATATSLLLVGIAATIGLVGHWRAGRVDIGTGIAFGLAGIGGSLAGSALNQGLDEDLLLLGFSGLVMLAAWRMLTACPTCTRVGEVSALGAKATAGSSTAIDLRSATTLLIAGTVVGFLTGLFGVGGGFIIVPALALVRKLPMPTAIGTSLLVVSINSMIALGARLGHSAIDWEVTLPFVIAAAGGVVTGSRVANRLDAKRSLAGFAALLVLVAGYTAIRATMALMQQ